MNAPGEGWDDLTLGRLKRGIAARNARLDEQDRLRRAVEAHGGKLTLFEADGVRTVRLWPDGISDEVKEQIHRADEILLDGALALGLLGPVGLRLRGEPAGDIGPFRPPAATDPVVRSYGGCQGTTRAGEQCRAIASLPSGYCRVHDPETLAANSARKTAAAEEARRKATPGEPPPGGAEGSRKAQAQGAVAGRRPHSAPYRPFTGQCTGLNSKGKPCRLPALAGSDRCEHHPRIGP